MFFAILFAVFVLGLAKPQLPGTVPEGPTAFFTPIPIVATNETAPTTTGPNGNETSLPEVPVFPAGNETVSANGTIPANETAPANVTESSVVTNSTTETNETQTAATPAFAIDATPSSADKAGSLESVAAAAAQAAAAAGHDGLICVCKTDPAEPAGTYVCRCAPTAAEALIEPPPVPGPIPNDTKINIPVEQPAPAVNETIGAGNGTANETAPPTAESNDLLEVNDTAAASSSGNVTRTFVVCVKNKADGPTSDYLTDASGKSIQVSGEWMYYRCKSGLIEPFKISKSLYNKLLKHCQTKGYDYPQPNDDLHPSSYPFEYDGFISEYNRHRTPFIFNHIPKTPADRCEDLRKHRRTRH